MKKSFYTFILCCFITLPTYAWNSNGHKVVAQIAYDNLTPEVQAKVNILVPVIGQYYDVRNFVDAAVWADWLKNDNIDAFNHWHYIDQPITQGLCYKCKMPLPEPGPENVVWAILQAEQVLSTLPDSTKYPQQSDFEKSWFLLYLEHFVADIHQPLHAVTMFSNTFPNDQYPNGDEGGNFYVIHATIADNLHSYWDQGAGIFSGSRMDDRQIKTLAMKIERVYPKAYFGDKMTDLNPHDWAQESMDISKNIVYSIPENTEPSSEYAAAAQTTAQKRVALAGYRLATLLNQILG